jgi:acetyl-CoA synthetase
VVRRRQAQRLPQLPRPPRRAGRGDKVAYHWEGEPGDTRTITYADLLAEVQRFANVLKGLGVSKGDRSHLHADDPRASGGDAGLRAHRSPRTPWSSAASARFADRPHQRRRVQGGDHRRRRVPSRGTVDAQAQRRHGVASTPSIEHVIVLKRVDEPIDMHDGRDLWWHDLMEQADAECPCEPMDSEDLLYLLYTSGTTAKPKGIMHTTGGYLTQVAFTHKYVFDLHPDTDIYWCCGRHRLGHRPQLHRLRPLTNGATSVIYEGVPDSPGRDRLGTSPSATASPSSTPRPPPSARS